MRRRVDESFGLFVALCLFGLLVLFLTWLALPGGY